MANYYAIKAAVNAYIKQNGRKEITGSILNAVLNATIDSLGRFFQFAGGAMPTDDPGTPDQNVCYLATEPGLYTHFGNIRIANEEVALLFWNGEWVKESIALGIQEVNASVDNQVGTPSVDVSYRGGQLVLTFHNLKGEQGETGDPAGFGTIGADINGGVGTPGVSVETSGDNTAKNLMFHFTNLKGETGVTSVVATIDNTSGTPSCRVALANGVLTLAFSGLKGLKGDTGVSADYPITIYNGLDSDATDQALSAAQGKVLQGEINQLEVKVDENAILSRNEINLVSSCPYFVSSLVGAYVPSTIITSNQYTANYVMFLFRIPAGQYHIKCVRSSVNRGVVVGTMASIEDFAIGGTISGNIIQNQVAGYEQDLSLSTETLLFLVGRNDVIPPYENYYVTVKKIDETSVKDAINGLIETVGDIGAENLGERMDAVEEEVFKDVYTNIISSSPYFVSSLDSAYVPYSNFVSNAYTGAYKCWLFRLPAGKYRLKKTGHYVSNVSTVIGTVANVADFVVGGTISNSLINGNSDAEIILDFSAETLLFIVGRTDVFVVPENWYATCEKIDTVGVISDVEEKVDNMFKVDLNIIIPDVVYAIVGTEFNIYNDAVSLSIDRGLHSPLNYQIRWACNKGTITDRCFRFTPASGDVGNVSCSCYLYDMRGVLVGSKTFTIKVLAKNALASAKNIVYFGDSLGASAATALYNNFHDSNRFGGTIPKMLGTKGTTKNYEAVGGYTWSSYATAGSTGYRIFVNGVTSMQVGAVYSDGSHNFEVYEVNITEGVGNCLLGRHYTNPGTLTMPSGTLTKVSGGGDASVPYTDAFQESVNPLWNDTTQELDINQYKQTLVSLGQLNSVSDKIDAVSFQFGINDNTLASNLDTLRGYISDLYDLFVGDNADCKFIVGLTTSSGNDVNGSGANYGATNDWKAYLKNTYIIRKFYLSLLTDFPNMRIATPNLSLDRYYGYALGTRQVSNRCTETEQYHTNYVHPGTSGYFQMADAYLACYVGVLIES